MFGGATPLPPDLIRSIQAVYLNNDGAISVVHRVADLEEFALLHLQHHGVVGIERCVDHALSEGQALGCSEIHRAECRAVRKGDQDAGHLVLKHHEGV
jgi:hypothetical protein